MFFALSFQFLKVLMLSLFWNVDVSQERYPFLQQRISTLVPQRILYCFNMLRLKPNFLLLMFHCIGLRILFCMILQWKHSKMMRLKSEIGCLCVELRGGPFYHEPLCGPQVGWRTLIKMFFSHSNSYVTLSYMAFLFFFPFSHHHHFHVNFSLSFIFFH